MKPNGVLRVVIIDGGYDSYETKERILAPFGARIVLQPCDRNPERMIAALAEVAAVLARVFRGEEPRNWLNRWAP